ncbi:unnamed protein product, partial [Linum tenue]
PPEIGRLRRLRTLFLYNNSLGGEIPSNISGCSALAEVHVRNNKLVGSLPRQLGFLKSLEELLLHRNYLDGEIPSSIFNLTLLTLLSLGENRLHGNLPWNMATLLPNLENFYVPFNQLTGSLPPSLSNASSMVQLQLQVNNFTGSVPSMASSHNLLRLNIAENFLGSGKVNGDDLGFLSTLTNARKLQALVISINNFGGNLPEQIGNLSSSIEILVLDNNQISGSIPEGLQNLVNLEVLLANGNKLSGSFGSVYKGVVNINGEEITIAVKVFNLQHSGASKSFMTECEVLKNIRHRNLVRILTVCSGVDYQGNDFKALVYEFVVNGSLENWLHPVESVDDPPRHLKFHQRLNVAINIASALDYIHNLGETPIVHCDLKPDNVLLDEDMVAHVGDFGLARFLESPGANLSLNGETSSSIGIKGTEYGMGNEISIEGDMYSFGILLLEMFTGRRPIDESFSDGVNLQNFVNTALLGQGSPISKVVDPILLNEILHGRIPEKALISILEIGVACSFDSPQERLNSSEVLTRLNRQLALLMIFSKPKREAKGL